MNDRVAVLYKEMLALIIDLSLNKEIEVPWMFRVTMDFFLFGLGKPVIKMSKHDLVNINSTSFIVDVGSVVIARLGANITIKCQVSGKTSFT